MSIALDIPSRLFVQQSSAGHNGRIKGDRVYLVKEFTSSIRRRCSMFVCLSIPSTRNLPPALSGSWRRPRLFRTASGRPATPNGTQTTSRCSPPSDDSALSTHSIQKGPQHRYPTFFSQHSAAQEPRAPSQAHHHAPLESAELPSPYPPK